MMLVSSDIEHNTIISIRSTHRPERVPKKKDTGAVPMPLPCYTRISEEEAREIIPEMRDLSVTLVSSNTKPNAIIRIRFRHRDIMYA